MAEPSGKFESIAFLTESNVRLSAMNKVLDFLIGLTIFILFFLTDWAEFIMNSERTVFNLLNYITFLSMIELQALRVSPT